MLEMNDKTTTLSPDYPASEVAGDVDVAPTAFGRDYDVAAQFLANLDPSVRGDSVSAKEARKVLWKIDLCLLPLIAGSVILSAVDKNIISNAAIYGMEKDTGLVGNDFSWVGSIFFFGYLVFEWPMAYLIQLLPVAKCFAATVLGWGIIAMCTAATQNFAGLATVRFLMGGLEAIIYPTCSILTVMWWKSNEQPVRVAFWFNTFSTVFTGTISYGIGHANTSLAKWRLLFLVLGGFTVLWAIFLFVFLPDSPVSCWWLSDREKFVCLQRIRENNTGVEDKKIKWYQVKECLLDAKTWLIVIFSCAQNIPNGGVNTFASLTVSGFGFNRLQTVLISIPTGVLGTLWQVLLSIPSAKLKGYRCIIIALSDLVPLVCAVLLWQLPRSNRNGLLAAYYCFYTYFTPYVLVTSLPMANTSGHTKKVTMNALFFLSYSLGNILGPQAFRSTNAPSYSNGFIGLVACIAVGICSISIYGWICYRDNKKRDLEAEVNEMSILDETFSDLTDKEKRSFRYAY